jgi:hypothetical protein
MLVVEVALAVEGECEKNTTKTETVVEHSQQRFQRVIKDNYSALIVYVDTETNVMYLRRIGDGGICVMVDAEGKPLLWDGGTTK